MPTGPCGVGFFLYAYSKKNDTHQRRGARPRRVCVHLRITLHSDHSRHHRYRQRAHIMHKYAVLRHTHRRVRRLHATSCGWLVLCGDGRCVGWSIDPYTAAQCEGLMKSSSLCCGNPDSPTRRPSWPIPLRGGRDCKVSPIGCQFI